LFAAVLRISDPIMALIAGVLTHRAYLESWSLPDRYQWFLFGAALAVAALFPLFRLYEAQRGLNIGDEFRRLVFAWLLIAAVAGTTLFVTKTGETFSRVWVMAWMALSLFLTATLRISVRLTLRHLRQRGFNLRHIAIVGAGELGRTIGTRLQDASWAGFNIIAFYDDDASKHGTEIAGRIVRGSADMLSRDIEAGGIDQVWIAMPLRAEKRIHEILSALRAYSIEVRFVPDIYSFHLLNHSMTEIAGLPVVSLTETPMSGPNRVVKAVEDYVLAALFLSIALPLIPLIALGVKLSSPGPVFYRQQRVTWNGEQFSMLKFRTMPVDTERATGPVWTRRGERRATAFGRFLRRFSLDELPQLLNVLKGDMSLVGPRPERPELVAQFKLKIPGYMQKHLVKAGITGWAQVHDLRGDSDLVKRIEYDLFYIENWSVWFDLRILLLTVAHLLKSRNAL
jgi:putative colanic acid biosynthesis UDP-glucose lipid carrier transferase